MKTIKGPAIFLAQFMGDKAPFNDMKTICQWAKSLGFVGVQIPTWDGRCIHLQKAAESKTYADELKGLVNECGLEITELSTHLQGQLVVHYYGQQFIHGRNVPLAWLNLVLKSWPIDGCRY